jgi:hypothetical protein
MDEQNQPEGHRLTADEVGARVGAILSDAEREAREIIASARQQGSPPDTGATIEDLAHALEQLNARFDTFELATAAQIENLGRQLRESLTAARVAPCPEAAVPAEVAPDEQAAPPSQVEESPELASARMRAIDLALAGYSRERIASQLAGKLEHPQVEALLDEVLVD